MYRYNFITSNGYKFSNRIWYLFDGRSSISFTGPDTSSSSNSYGARRLLPHLPREVLFFDFISTTQQNPLANTLRFSLRLQFSDLADYVNSDE